MATESVKIADPDNGAGTDYTSLSAWEAGEQKDLVTADEIAVAKCRCTSGSADTSAVTIDGWTTDADRYIKIWTDPSENYRHNGKWDENAYRLVDNATMDAVTVLEVAEAYTHIEGIQITIDISGGSRAVNFNTGSDNSRISHCILRNTIGSSTDGIYIRNVNGIKVYNNLVYDFTRYGIIDEYNYTGHAVYNNTVIDCTTYGYYFHSNTPLKNNIGKGCGEDFHAGGSGFNSDCDYNASSDGTAPGANSRTNQTFTFVDEANDDFHLASDDAGAKDYGADLSSDPNLSFNDDIDGETRSGTWDIGADEYVAAGGAITKIMDETVSVSETLIRRLYANRFIGETVAITETMPRRGYSNRLIDETISISEGILRRLRSNRIINETMSIAEALSRRAFSTRVINETLSIAETVLRRLRAVRIISETVSISESLVRRLRSVRVINETVDITEDFVCSCVSTVVKIMDETVSITETLVRRLYSKRIMDETVSISEGILRRLRSVRTMAENISISEVLNRRGFLTKIINETVSVTEAFVRSCIAGIVKIMNETVAVTESLMRKCISSRMMQETLDILEALGRRCRMSRVTTEMLSVAEAMGRRCRMVKVLNEAVSVVETMVRSCFATLVKIMSETVSVEESLTKVMTLIEVVVGKMSFKARRASASFKKFMAKIGFSKRGG